MKRLYIIVILLLLSLSLTGCKEAPILSLDVYNYEYEMKLLYHMSQLYEPKLIKTYDEYSNLIYASDDESHVLYEKEYFDKNSIYIIPIYSYKEPTFEIRDYTYNEGEMHISINQVNSFYRTSNLVWDNKYYVILELDTKDIDNMSMEIIEKNDYYKHILYKPDERIVLNDGFDILFSYDELTEVIDEQIVNNITVLNETLFEDSFVILYTYPGLTGGENPFPLDLYYDESLDEITYQVNIVGASNLISSSNYFSILIVNKTNEISTETEFTVEKSQLN